LKGRAALLPVVTAALLSLVSLVLAGCSAATATSAGSTAVASPASPVPSASAASAVPVSSSPATSSHRPAATTAARTQATFSAIVTAGGVRQWLHCAGPGPLTLVVVPGLDAAATTWSPVLGQLQAIVRTCIYDRPGIGASPARPDPRQIVDAGLLAGELWALLQAAGQRGPYLVLGHSFGGLVARAFVAEHRSAVRGVLLAESVSPFDPASGRYWTEAGHQVDLTASSVATDGGPALGPVPLLVLSASRPDEDHLGGPTYGQPTWMTALWIRQQAGDPSLSSASIHVIATSGHVLQQDDPPAVVESVRELVTAVRTGQRLDCDGPWRAVAATCS